MDSDGIFDIQQGEQYREHYANVGVSHYLNKALHRCGFDTLKVAWDDDNGYDDLIDISLGDRQRLIKQNQCDLSVSIHFNAFGYGDSFNSASGICTFYHNNSNKVGDSIRFAQCVQQHLAQGTPQQNRGIISANFAMCNCLAMGTKASILCELAFMTNEHEAVTMMANQDYWIESAEEICKGICEYTGISYIEPNVINNDEEDFMSNQEKFNEMLQIAFKELGEIDPSTWSQEARDWAESNGYIKGDENGNKKYKKPTTREEMVQVFYNILGNK